MYTYIHVCIYIYIKGYALCRRPPGSEGLVLSVWCSGSKVQCHQDTVFWRTRKLRCHPY